jgi:site-specific DNA-cytosine methylase
VFDASNYAPVETKNYHQFDVSGKGHKSQQDRAYKTTGKFGCLPNARAKTKIKIWLGNDSYRNLTLNEAESLQNVPHNYTHIDEGFSLDKSLSALGNGWTVDVIAHIFSFMKKEPGLVKQA